MSYIKWDAQIKFCLKKKRFILLFLLAFLLLILLLRYAINTENDLKAQSLHKCLFCGIAKGRGKSTRLEFENDEFAIFKDIRPASEHHYLAVPKQHYESLKALNKSHVGLIYRMHNGMLQFLESKGIDTNEAVIGYHIPPFISQKHLHLHGIAPASGMHLLDRISFFTPSFWFKLSEDAVNSLNRTEL